MPYKKKYVAKKRRSFKKRSVVKKLAKKVNKLYKAIEVKHGRVAGLGALPDNNPTLGIRPYPSIAQGLGDYNERNGDKITVKYVKFKSVWEHQAGYFGRVCRTVAFIMKNNPDGIASALSTIWNLYAESTYANGINVVNGNTDFDNRANFVTLYDQKRVINPDLAAVTKSMSWDVMLKIPQKYQTVQYFNNTTTVSKNELFIFLIQDTDNGLAINYVTEYFYSDV